MIQRSTSPQLSAFADLYDVVVPQDHKLRKMNDLIDFSFIYEELEGTYSLNFGRSAIDPIRMFKYLLLKSIYPLSDVDLVERSKYDMSFKYFLGMTPEEEVINPSSLTKFRKMRLQNIEMLDLLIGKTVEIAIEKGIIESQTIIVDATHTKSRYNQKKPQEILRERSKQLRKAVYEINETLKSSFPAKPEKDDLQEEIQYSEALMDVIEKTPALQAYSKVTEPLNLLRETVDDDLERLQSMNDRDARVGHKTADTSFFGYKTHMAMSDERIITAAVVTTGEK
ncbi:transposase, partial [Shouchella shacheensis]|uniref:transposase n=1 Tax=Shouchella shacheensis TaxID=1649580 RepID=UPI000AF45FD7